METELDIIEVEGSPFLLSKFNYQNTTHICFSTMSQQPTRAPTKMPTFTEKRSLRGEERPNPQIKSELQKLLATPKALSYLKPNLTSFEKAEEGGGNQTFVSEYEYTLKAPIKIDKKEDKGEGEEEEEPPGLDGQ